MHKEQRTDQEWEDDAKQISEQISREHCILILVTKLTQIFDAIREG